MKDKTAGERCREWINEETRGVVNRVEADEAVYWLVINWFLYGSVRTWSEVKQREIRLMIEETLGEQSEEVDWVQVVNWFEFCAQKIRTALRLR
jgi:antibiotic biosynthesis monooxygenase (ABM) superfamily enzyme